MEWLFMAKQLHPSLTSASPMKNVAFKGIKHLPLESGAVETVLYGEESHLSVWKSDGHVWVWQLPGQQHFPD